MGRGPVYYFSIFELTYFQFFVQVNFYIKDFYLNYFIQRGSSKENTKN